MLKHRPYVPSLVALVLGVIPSLGMATSSQLSTHLNFTVLKDGDPIGHHDITVEQNGDAETVSIKTNILVKVAFVPVYRFEHVGHEVWQNGHLVSLVSQTNDDGDKHKLSVAVKSDHLDVDGDGQSSQADSAIIPASLWNYGLVKQSTLLNTLTGKQMHVSVADLGDDSIQSHGVPLKAHHYKVSGELQRELWYDQSNTLVQVKFKAKDDSDILYVLG